MSTAVVKRKVFISFFQPDRPEVDAFIDTWAVRAGVFTPRALGVTSNTDFIDSTDPEYVMRRIRADLLGDSTVTIVLIGKCTHSRRYVDWELKSSLRRGEYTPNGLLGILLPSANGSAHLPPRFGANYASDSTTCYARFRPYPADAGTLRSWIEDAYEARTARADAIQNASEMMKYNRECKVHKETH